MHAVVPKHTFTFVAGGSEVQFSTEDSDLGDLVSVFASYLRGCGYAIKGDFEIVPDDEVVCKLAYLQELEEKAGLGEEISTDEEKSQDYFSESEALTRHLEETEETVQEVACADAEAEQRSAADSKMPFDADEEKRSIARSVYDATQHLRLAYRTQHLTAQDIEVPFSQVERSSFDTLAVGSAYLPFRHSPFTDYTGTVTEKSNEKRGVTVIFHHRASGRYMTKVSDYFDSWQSTGEFVASPTSK